ncbi:type II CRISPR-associated endonuclease Cas1 [Brumimicrobium salinarum]|uniref:CRISPR-associated endonuclease Cas1 n=1 Tax=Brumimicrobium salinarum TaxID=2058658 RepID=A0A2I0R2N8_9FLAO|nr:type II CRISPR-associated endonuclease Cas1 [Brumimicrobium salinarum]PKR80851.1 type II CRISPR-associated endonuclease Cas1 [Brumimicrobium salinarum]
MIKRTLFFENPAYLSTKNNQLVVRLIETEQTKTVPIEDIGMMVLEHQQITFTNHLIEKLTYQNAAIVCCNQQHLPLSLISPLSGHSEYNERLRYQLEASQPLKKNLWQQTIIAKISNQANLLGKLDKVNSKLRKWSGEVLSGDSTNKESHAAAYYWEQLFSEIPGFYRGQKEIPPNNLLNYGYAILRAVCARSIIGSGMLPALGIHHANKYNAYCLADDIMEPYRPFVDQVVHALVQQTSNIDQLTRDLKQQLLIIPAIDVTIDGKGSPLMVAMSRTTHSLFECFSGISRKILYPTL